MKNKKLFVVVLCAFVICLTMAVGCGGGEANNVEKETGEQEEKKIVLRMAGQNPIDNADTQSMYDIKERVERESNGRIEINVYPANQLGDYTLVYEELMRGTIDMALISVAPTYDDRLLLSYMPFIAENYEEVNRLYAPGGFMYNVYKEVHGSLGVEFLGFYGEGLGGIGTTKMPVEPLDPSVDKGILIRVPGIDSLIISAEDMGYRTTSIPYAEVYTAMQTGVVDGWIGGTASLNWHGFRDVIKYYLQKNNFFEATFYLASQSVWETLSPEDQRIIREAVEEQSLKSFERSEEQNANFMNQMREAGIEVIEFSDEELRTLATHIRNVSWPKIAERIGKDIVEELKQQYD